MNGVPYMYSQSLLDAISLYGDPGDTHFGLFRVEAHFRHSEHTPCTFYLLSLV